MCFYEHYRFECGDYKWGNFKQHCNKEYRMGETCGMKLIMETYQLGNKCNLCEKLDRKLRKREAEVARIYRWSQEGTNPASIEKAQHNVAILDYEIQVIYRDLDARRRQFNTRRDNVAYA